MASKTSKTSKITSSKRPHVLFNYLKRTSFVKDDKWLKERITFFSKVNTEYARMVAAGAALRWSNGTEEFRSAAEAAGLMTAVRAVEQRRDAIVRAALRADSIEQMSMMVRAKCMSMLIDIADLTATRDPKRESWRAAATRVLVTREEVECVLTLIYHAGRFEKPVLPSEEDAAAMNHMVEMVDGVGFKFASGCLDRSYMDEAHKEEALKRAWVFDEGWWLECVGPRTMKEALGDEYYFSAADDAEFERGFDDDAL